MIDLKLNHFFTTSNDCLRCFGCPVIILSTKLPYLQQPSFYATYVRRDGISTTVVLSATDYFDIAWKLLVNFSFDSRKSLIVWQETASSCDRSLSEFLKEILA